MNPMGLGLSPHDSKKRVVWAGADGGSPGAVMNISKSLIEIT